MISLLLYLPSIILLLAVESFFEHTRTQAQTYRHAWDGESVHFMFIHLRINESWDD